jgi:hypothetical protein
VQYCEFWSGPFLARHKPNLYFTFCHVRLDLFWVNVASVILPFSCCSDATFEDYAFLLPVSKNKCNNLRSGGRGGHEIGCRLPNHLFWIEKFSDCCSVVEMQGCHSLRLLQAVRTSGFLSYLSVPTLRISFAERRDDCEILGSRWVIYSPTSGSYTCLQSLRCGILLRQEIWQSDDFLIIMSLRTQMIRAANGGQNKTWHRYLYYPLFCSTLLNEESICI